MNIKELEKKVIGLETRLKIVEDYMEQERKQKIAELQAENTMLEYQLQAKGMPTLEKFIKDNA